MAWALTPRYTIRACGVAPLAKPTAVPRHLEPPPSLHYPHVAPVDLRARVHLDAVLRDVVVDRCAQARPERGAVAQVAHADGVARRLGRVRGPDALLRRADALAARAPRLLQPPVHELVEVK